MSRLGRPSTSDAHKFYKYVIVTEGDSCWGWKGCVDHEGYAVISIFGTKLKASRASWMLHRGKDIKGLCVCHKCDNRLCSKPGHLFLGTVADNNTDCQVKGRTCRGEKNNKAKLTEKQVRYIKSLKLKRGDLTRLAKRFGVIPNQIWRIVHKVCWKHI